MMMTLGPTMQKGAGLPTRTHGFRPRFTHIRGLALNVTGISFSNEQLHNSETQELVKQYFAMTLKGSSGRNMHSMYPKFCGC